MEAVIAVAVAKLTVNSGIGWTGLNLIETARRKTLVHLWTRILSFAAGPDMADVRSAAQSCKLVQLAVGVWVAGHAQRWRLALAARQCALQSARASAGLPRAAFAAFSRCAARARAAPRLPPALKTRLAAFADILGSAAAVAASKSAPGAGAACEASTCQAHLEGVRVNSSCHIRCRHSGGEERQQVYLLAARIVIEGCAGGWGDGFGDEGGGAGGGDGCPEPSGDTGAGGPRHAMAMEAVLEWRWHERTHSPAAIAHLQRQLHRQRQEEERDFGGSAPPLSVSASASASASVSDKDTNDEVDVSNASVPLTQPRQQQPTAPVVAASLPPCTWTCESLHVLHLESACAVPDGRGEAAGKPEPELGHGDKCESTAEGEGEDEDNLQEEHSVAGATGAIEASKAEAGDSADHGAQANDASDGRARGGDEMPLTGESSYPLSLLSATRVGGACLAAAAKAAEAAHAALQVDGAGAVEQDQGQGVGQGLGQGVLHTLTQPKSDRAQVASREISSWRWRELGSTVAAILATVQEEGFVGNAVKAQLGASGGVGAKVEDANTPAESRDVGVDGDGNEPEATGQSGTEARREPESEPEPEPFRQQLWRRIMERPIQFMSNGLLDDRQLKQPRGWGGGWGRKDEEEEELAAAANEEGGKHEHSDAQSDVVQPPWWWQSKNNGILSWLRKKRWSGPDLTPTPSFSLGALLLVCTDTRLQVACTAEAGAVAAVCAAPGVATIDKAENKVEGEAEGEDAAVPVADVSPATFARISRCAFILAAHRDGNARPPLQLSLGPQMEFFRAAKAKDTPRLVLAAVPVFVRADAWPFQQA